MIRKLPISFGMHSVILIVIVSVFISYYFKNSFYLSLMSMAALFTILIGSENLMLIFFSTILDMDIGLLLRNNLYWFLSGLPHILIIALIGYMIKFCRGRYGNQ